MSDHFQTEPFAPLPDKPPPPCITKDQPELPAWLAERLLRPHEEIAWVRGPRVSPPWEPFATHPLLFVYALAIGTGCVFVGRLIAGSWVALPPWAALPALLIVFGSVFALGVSCGHFTRLVVTNLRLFIVQGRELCSSWDLDDLPPHLIRYTMRDGEKTRAVDLDAVTAMLDGMSGKFTEAKSIVEFGKKLDQITLRDKRLP